MLHVSEWIIDAQISSRGHNVELGIKYINTIHHPVQTWQCECLVALILPNSILTAMGRRNMDTNQAISLEFGSQFGGTCSAVYYTQS
jgi:hypothetical protein